VLQVIADDDRELLVPVIDDVIREVDRESGRIVIEVVEGLFGDESDD
jgi:ribosomal 30S subunit maturation factor RimM